LLGVSRAKEISGFYVKL